jgi:Flp pilus assembly protein TadG
MMNLISRIRHRTADERGAAMVELSLVLPVLLLLVLGGITFGLILGFRQTAEEAASEGARAAMVTFARTSDSAQAQTAAVTQADSSMASWEPTCDPEDGDDDGLGCWVYVHDCANQVSGRLEDSVDPATLDTAAEPDCVTVVVNHDYEQKPFLPKIPLLDNVLPETIATAATVQLSTE